MHVGALVLTAYLVLSAFKYLGKIKQTSFSGKKTLSIWVIMYLWKKSGVL